MTAVSGFPQRIVCLTEETTETLYLLGEEWRLVGISGFTARPPRARREKPRVSAFTSARTDRIVALQPDLVLGFSDLQADIAAELVRVGLEVHVFNHRSVADILRMIRTLGGMIGCAGKAQALTDELGAALAQVRVRAARLGRHPRGARRLRARDQVLAHPAAGACGADRWRARGPGDHRGVGAARLSHAAPLADQFVGLDDLLRALLGVRHHRLRQAVGLELVGMMAVQLPAVGLDDRLIARARAGLEHAIGLLERAVARRGAGATRLTRARAATLDAQHRLDVRQLL